MSCVGGSSEACRAAARDAAAPHGRREKAPRVVLLPGARLGRELVRRAQDHGPDAPRLVCLEADHDGEEERQRLPRPLQ